MTPKEEAPASEFQEAGEAHVRAILDTIPARVAFIDRQRRHRYANQEYATLVGKSVREIVGHTIAEILGPETYERLREAGERALAGETVRWEGWLTYPRAGERYVQRVYSPYVAPSGAVDGYFIFVRDLTALKQGERALAERIEALRGSEALNAAITASALDCIVVIDEAGLVVEFNPAAERTFGYARAETLGRSIAELIIPPELRDRHSHGLRRYLDTGEKSVLGRRIEIEGMRADGTRLPIELAIAEVRLPDRRLFTAYLRNLTEVRDAAAEIERQRDALHQSEKLSALGSLLAGVAHELNNPLSIVIGHTAMLRDEAAEASPIELETRAQKIQNAAERCARIVRTFLAMARQRSTERRAVALGTVARGALELLGYGLRTSGVEVEAEIADDLPTVWADEDQLHQVVLNLLVNAQQALDAAPRPRRLTLSVGADAARARIRVRVADNGPGVPEQIRSRIFDPFFTTKPTGTGTGIGLAVSRGIAEAHGGSLALEAPSGGGAAFTLELPVAPAGAGAEPRPTGRLAAAAAAATRRALIIDDEPDIAGVLAQILARQGFRADVATGGREAQRLVAAQDYDAILCDLRMPDLDGPAFYEFLAAERAHLCARTVFVTGDTLGQAASQFVVASGRPVIEKPFVPDEVRRVIAALD